MPDIGLKNLHSDLYDANISSSIFDLHDIAYLSLTNRQIRYINPFLHKILENCRNENEISQACLLYCFNNPLFAVRWLLGVNLMPFQGAVIQSLWHHRFSYFLASRGAGKSYLLAVFALIRALLIPGSQIVIISNSFRQAKFVFRYIRAIYENWPILQQITYPSQPSMGVDMCTFKIGNSNIIVVPIGDKGETIRGLRSNCTLADEFQVMDPEVFAQVVMGFGAVSQAPDQRVKELARQESSWIGYTKGDKKTHETGNQIVLSSTASFEFNHAFKWYSTYKDIIKTRGKKEALKRFVGYDLSDSELAYFDWKDFCVLTLPYKELPKGFMDEKNIINMKVQLAEEIFDMEYNCCWIKDTKGFIPISLIRSNTTGKTQLSSATPCVMGVDPARSSDNFSITISVLEDDMESARAVYNWSFNEKRLKEEFYLDEIPELGFYSLAALKILYLTEKFNIQFIVMDKGGGGPAVADVLKAPSLYTIPAKYSKLPICDIEDEDVLPNSRQMLNVLTFDPKIIIPYNYMWKRDIQGGKFLFSDNNSERGNLSNIGSENEHLLFDSYDFINNENEQMKREIAIVKLLPTPGGTIRFDTGTGGSRPKKDRYSSCFMSFIAWKILYDKINSNEGQVKYEEYDTEGKMCKTL